MTSRPLLRSFRQPIRCYSKQTSFSPHLWEEASQSIDSPPAPPPPDVPSSDASEAPPPIPSLSLAPIQLPHSSKNQVNPRLLNPFHTHAFYKKLEKEFSPPIAHVLMRATRGSLIDKISKARRVHVDVLEGENQQYLYRAALSELRTEVSMRTRNESIALQTSVASIKKEVESLASKMKGDLDKLKDDVQMDMDNRKNEVNIEKKKASIAIEELHHKAIVQVSDVRTEIEQAKWDNTRRGVLIIGSFVLFAMASWEVAPKPEKTVKKSNPPKDEGDANASLSHADKQSSDVGAQTSSSVR
ncbi:uncharacterized protein EI90DRAFT_1300524 [Cantharellus anzutake]|uniref:uncharacterized protein n=1 Tax=Cantharellus anzutake TaxID=1750568 RepID=UPI0019053387|nr:uncharacterized protein EI90DRAFT_1300524 [Cantharellus anzutake]KAF8342065.1 hypothetical protein EI90DRAFT_1300524 [Cantharellus anzutake]